MKPSTFLTAGEAARATGKSVPTITRAIKQQRIQGGVTRGDNGQYQIDPAALFNVYPPLDPAQVRNSNAQPQTQGDVTPLLDTAYTAALDALKEVIAAKDALIQDKEESIGQYKKRLAQSENLLTDQRDHAEKIKADLEAAHTESANPEPRKLTWYERLTGKTMV